MQIETKRLLLREFVLEDWPSVLAYQSDPRYQRFYPLDGRTAEEARDFVRMFLAQQQARPRLKFQLAAVLKKEDRLIGNCGIRMESPEAVQADIGYEFSPDYWGNGYATEAAQAMLDFGFRQLKAHRIWSWCLAENLASGRVLEKLGMQLEGRLRENEFFKGRWWDTLLYAILEPEWRRMRQR